LRLGIPSQQKQIATQNPESIMIAIRPIIGYCCDASVPRSKYRVKLTQPGRVDLGGASSPIQTTSTDVAVVAQVGYTISTRGTLVYQQDSMNAA
jgi:hypothetical protein